MCDKFNRPLFVLTDVIIVYYSKCLTLHFSTFRPFETFLKNEAIGFFSIVVTFRQIMIFLFIFYFLIEECHFEMFYCSTICFFFFFLKHAVLLNKWMDSDFFPSNHHYQNRIKLKNNRMKIKTIEIGSTGTRSTYSVKVKNK